MAGGNGIDSLPRLLSLALNLATLSSRSGSLRQGFTGDFPLQGGVRRTPITLTVAFAETLVIHCGRWSGNDGGGRSQAEGSSVYLEKASY